ncbi:MAG: GNAT family N-acetyltransferase [Chloroflexi bacterium]|nr:GNAT family N-acetyltransferase [Chloroflexota bacterium]
MALAVEVGRLTGENLPALTVEIDRARAAGELRASADADAEYFLKSFAVDPTIVTGAFAGDELIGFISPEFKAIAVRPDRRHQGVGRVLAGAAVDGERLRGRPDVILGVLPDDARGLAFLGATGFAFHSTLWDLDLPHDSAVPEPIWPAGLIQRPFDRDRDVEPWIALFNVAFADHATPLQLDASFIVAGLDDPAIVDDDTAIVEDEASGELVAFCATSPIRRDGVVQPHGEIWTIGVRPDRQGAGLGRQLLRWGAGYLRSLGVPDVSLSVNGRNERALGLYESEGYVRGRTRERWARSTATGIER